MKYEDVISFDAEVYKGITNSMQLLIDANLKSREIIACVVNKKQER